MVTRVVTVPEWAAELRAQGYAAATVQAMTAAVWSCARYLGVAPTELTRAGVVSWLGARDRATWTRIKYIDWLTAWAVYAGCPEAVEGLRRPRAPAGVPRPVSEESLAAMLAIATGRTRAWLLLGGWCGLRAHESAKVAVEDLQRLAGGDHVLRVVGKGGLVAVVPCPPVVVEELRRHAAGQRSGRLWPSATSVGVQAAVRRVAARAGVVCTSHQLRHRYGTVFYGSSRDLLLTQQVMRHRSPSTTAGYAAVTADRAQSVAATLPGAFAETAGRPRLRLVR